MGLGILDQTPANGRTRFAERAPSLLIALRFVLGPCLIAACAAHLGPGITLGILAAAMISDIFDGVIARRMKIVTEQLRIADSRTDAWFFICVGISAWMVAHDVIVSYAAPIVAEFVLQASSYLYDLVRYRRIASLHAYSAKLWGASLYISTGALIAFGYGPLIWLSFALGLVSFADALAIKLMLPGWRHDVLSCVHAWRLNRLGP